MYIGTYTPNTVTRHSTQAHGTTPHGPSIGTWDTIGDSMDGTNIPGIGHTIRGIGVILVNGTHSIGGSIITTTDSADTGTAGSIPHTAATATHHTQAATAAGCVAATCPAPQVRQEPTEEYAPPHPAPTATA